MHISIINGREYADTGLGLRVEVPKGTQGGIIRRRREAIEKCIQEKVRLVTQELGEPGELGVGREYTLAGVHLKFYATCSTVIVDEQVVYWSFGVINTSYGLSGHSAVVRRGKSGRMEMDEHQDTDRMNEYQARCPGGPFWHLEAYNPGDWEEVLSAAMSEASKRIHDRGSGVKESVLAEIENAFGLPLSEVA